MRRILAPQGNKPALRILRIAQENFDYNWTCGNQIGISAIPGIRAVDGDYGARQGVAN